MTIAQVKRLKNIRCLHTFLLEYHSEKIGQGRDALTGNLSTECDNSNEADAISVSEPVCPSGTFSNRYSAAPINRILVSIGTHSKDTQTDPVEFQNPFPGNLTKILLLSEMTLSTP